MAILETLLIGIVQLSLVAGVVAGGLWLIQKTYGLDKFNKRIDEFIEYIESVFFKE